MIAPTLLNPNRTIRRENTSTRRNEVWTEYSAPREDGVTEWAWERSDDEPATPWSIHHYPDDEDHPEHWVLPNVAGSCIQARRDTASGWAIRAKKRQDGRRAELLASMEAKLAAAVRKTSV